MVHLPIFIPVLFVLTAALTLGFFYKASHQYKKSLLIIAAWLFIQAGLSLTGFYLKTDGTPPRFALLLFPPLVTIILVFATNTGRKFLDGLDSRTLLLLHIIRLPVELALYSLYIHQAVPVAMTFEGGNWDILSGISAPLIWYAYQKQWLNKWGLLAWNLICLGLLVNVVTAALTQGLHYPGFALRYFPFSWLPALLVPLVLFSHLALIRKLIRAD